MIYADGSLSFFDSHDNYKFETVLPSTENTWIDYIEMINSWVTVTRSGYVEVWDLENLTSSQWIKILDSSTSLVNDSAELKRNKLYAVGTSDKKLYILDPIKRQTFKVLTISAGGINKLKYMSCYSTVVVAGFSRDVPIYELNVKHKEISRTGVLVGHHSNIAVIEVVENSPTVISVDDIPVVKLWDARTFKCIQTVNFKVGTTMLAMVAIPEHMKFAFISSRVNIIDLQPFFGDKYSNLLDPSNRELLVNDVVYDQKRKVFSVFSNKAVLEIAASNGATNRILTNTFNNETEDDLGKCDILVDQSLALMSDLNGNFIVQDMILNETFLRVGGNKKEVLSFEFDEQKRMMILAGYDNTIKIYYEPDKFCLANRHKQKSCDLPDSLIHPKSIIAGIEQHSTQKFFDYSIKYDVIFSVFPSRIAVFSLDNYKLLTQIKVPNNLEITAFKFARDTGVLMIGYSSDHIVMAKITRRTFGRIEFTVLGTIDLSQYLKVINKEVNKLRILKLGVGMFLKSLDIIYTDLKTSSLSDKIRIKRVTPLFIELSHNKDTDTYELIVGTVQACIIKFNATDGLSKKFKEMQEKKADYQVKGNYNFGKRVLINYDEQIDYMNTKPYTFDPATCGQELNNIQVSKVMHSKMKDPKCMKLIMIGATPYIISVFNPCYFLIMNSNLVPVCKLNINHPLPLFWNLTMTRDREATDRISEIKKFFTHILVHYQPTFAKLEIDDQIKNDILTRIVKKLVQDENSLDLKELQLLNSELQQISLRIGIAEVTLMKEAYHPKDIVYNRIRKENLSEVAGPSLYQMERQRRFITSGDIEATGYENPKLKDIVIKNFEEGVKKGIRNRMGKEESAEIDKNGLRANIDKAFSTEEAFFKRKYGVTTDKTKALKKLKSGCSSVISLSRMSSKHNIKTQSPVRSF